MSYEPILDISRYQYPVDFATMYSRGVRLLFLRLTVGDYYKDTSFDEFYASARNHGMYVGCDHVVKPSISPQAQFDKIIASLPFALLDVPLVLDCELTDGKSPAQITSNIVSLISLCYQTFGKYPIIYTRGEWWNTNTITNPLFALCPLWIARYTTLPHPWNDAPSLRPRDWTEWDIWQHSADGNLKGAYYGVGSASVDENRSDYDNVTDTVIALNGGQSVPPPDPIGEPLMQFQTKYLVNIRSGPNTTYPDIGDLPAGTVITAQEIQPMDNNSVWVRFDTGKWVAMVHNGGGPYLNFYAAVPPPDPVPTVLMQTITNTNLRWYNAVNGAGKPIMSVPPADNRPKFLAGAVIACKPGKIDCDGTVDYYEVLNGQHATPHTYTPPTGYMGWFVSELDVFEVQL